MKNGSGLLLRALLTVGSLLAVRVGPAAGYVSVTPPTLGALCNDSVNIYVLRVEKASREKGVILFTCVAQLKGKPDPTAARHVIPAALAVGGEKQTTAADVDGPKLILDWATEGKMAVFFTVTRGDDDPGGDVKGVGHAYIDNFWYTLSYNRDGRCWVAFKSERSLLTRYCGPADKLGDAVARILRGEEIVVPALVSDSKPALPPGRAPVQDVRASLQILNVPGAKPGHKGSDGRPANKKPLGQKRDGNTSAADKKKPEGK